MPDSWFGNIEIERLAGSGRGWLQRGGESEEYSESDDRSFHERELLFF
jgi:hypothetical protein